MSLGLMTERDSNTCVGETKVGTRTLRPSTFELELTPSLSAPQGKSDCGDGVLTCADQASKWMKKDREGE